MRHPVTLGYKIPRSHKQFILPRKSLQIYEINLDVSHTKLKYSMNRLWKRYQTFWFEVNWTA